MDVENLLARTSDSISVRRAFGTAYEKDGVLIIPVAIVVGGGGAGAAAPKHRDPTGRRDGSPGESGMADGAVPGDSGRMDAGGGSGGLTLPSGAYVVKGDEVRWVPVVDVTVIVLASLSLVRVLARTWTRRRNQGGRSSTD